MVSRTLAQGDVFRSGFAAYGASTAFVQGLEARGLHLAVEIPRNQKVYSAGVRLVATRGAGESRTERGTAGGREVLATQSWRRIA